MKLSQKAIGIVAIITGMIMGLWGLASYSNNQYKLQLVTQPNGLSFSQYMGTLNSAGYKTGSGATAIVDTEESLRNSYLPKGLVLTGIIMVGVGLFIVVRKKQPLVMEPKMPKHIFDLKQNVNVACPACNAEINRGGKFCPECGKELV
jgi:hypothetical protein